MTTLRIFLSSTFFDMQEEREVLVRHTFPELRLWAEKLGVHVAEVDLRWGVPREMSSLDVCLDEIDECRPLFVCFLGHSYGSRVADPHLTEELRCRFPWLARERPEGRSYTELEIIHAVLREDAPAMESLFYFRSAQCSAVVEQRARREVSPEDRWKLEELKHRLAGRAPLRPEYNSAEELGRWIKEDLKPLIAERARLMRQGTSWSLRKGRCWAGDAEVIETLTATALRHWQPGWFPSIQRRTNHPGLVIAGASGSGKSTLLAAWALLLQGEKPILVTQTEEDHGGMIAPSFAKLKKLSPRLLCLSADDCAGAEEDRESPGWSRLARRLMEFIREEWHPGLVIPPESEPLQVLYALPGALESIPGHERLLLCIDDPEAVRDRSRDDPLAWLPAELPPQIWVVVTARVEGAQWMARRNWAVLEIPDRLPGDLVERVLNARLSEYGKRLGEVDRRALRGLLGQVPPRWTDLVINDLREMPEPAGMRLYRAIPLRIESLSAVAQEPAALGRLLIEALAERHGGELVWRTIALLMEARTGLLEMEMRYLLSPGPDPLPSAEWSPVYLGMRDWIRPTSGLLVPGPELRIAWQAWLRALRPDEVQRRKGHAWRSLVDFFVIRGGDQDARALEQVPWLYRHSAKLRSLLTEPGWATALWRFRPREVLALWGSLGSQALVDSLEEWRQKYAQQFPDGWHALACACTRVLPGSGGCLEAARRARQLGCREAGLTEASELWRQGRSREAASVLQDLLRECTHGPIPLAAQARLQLAEILQPEQPDHATELVREALAMAGDLRDPALLMEACHFLGRYMLRREKPAEAHPFYTELQRVAGLVGNQHFLILALEGQGNALAYTKSCLSEAESLLRKALDLAVRCGDTAGERHLLGSLVDLLLRLNRWAEAFPLVERRIVSAHDANIPVEEANALWQRANLRRDSGGDYLQVTADLRAAIILARTAANPALVATLERMAEVMGR